ncbi:hypothetical protein KFL_002550020 [Klebsormidium nitens]|uniref:Uncharacterized protein n=1 Tax=Klebsormidium nitens TaxID=105231 RepID=A0A1Y1I4D8_KLENI|nr:hypothetical protein KFL_002550020 [Klebsormidium nitens]|eukprot:GAQ85795.1 hypothetical protein KFL_002550020 [Klebsormidium nitens]
MSRALKKVGQASNNCADVTNEPVVRNATTVPPPELGRERALGVERAFVDPLLRESIAYVVTRVGGVRGIERPTCMDSGADVNVMSLETENLNYDVLLGTTSMKKVNGVINFPKGRFEFQLPRTHKVVALNLITPPKRGKPIPQVQIVQVPSMAPFAGPFPPGDKAPGKAPSPTTSEGIEELPQVAMVYNLRRLRMKGIPAGIPPECWRRVTITPAGPQSPPTYDTNCSAGNNEDSSDSETGDESSQSAESALKRDATGNDDASDHGMPRLLPPDTKPQLQAEIGDDPVTSLITVEETLPGDASDESAAGHTNSAALRWTSPRHFCR